MRGIVVGLALLAMVAPQGVGRDTLAHRERLAESGCHDLVAMVTFARGAYDEVPGVPNRMSACVADVGSAACVR
jgi:hypothetical protein